MLLNKFRISDCSMEMELYCYKIVPREQQFVGYKEDEYHLFLYCKITHQNSILFLN